MKARVLSLDSDEHRQAQALLPWFVNGTLGAEESSRLVAHLDHCGRCQADAAAQATLRACPFDADAGGDVNRGWAALRARLDPRPPLPRAPLGAPWWKRGWPMALAVQSIVVLVLAVALVGITATRTEPYRALGAVPGGGEANALAVFRVDATEQEMREALRAVDARIVGGPTVTDAYLLRMNDLGADALARLRAQPGVLRVESLQGEPAR